LPKIVNTQKNCDCYFCKSNHDFELYQDIIDATKNNNLVIFAGAGVSTESKTVYNKTLYQEIREQLKITEDISFSALMSKFCEQPNGRVKLMQLIKKRLDYVNSFPELENRASSFHRELASIYQINEIITTNWDDLFEKKCGAIPIVTSKDFAFWNFPGRKVLKIHGSINNYGSIIATTEDYEECYKKLTTELIGSMLKTMLATKCVVFIGYSFGDEDFSMIHNALIEEMQDVMPHAYVVTVDTNAVEKFKGMNITPIVTDATFFISSLKKHLIQENLIVPDDKFSDILPVLLKVKEEHNILSNSFNLKESPELIYPLCYQDGLMHSFERILSMRHTGEYSNPDKVKEIIHNYDDHFKPEKLVRGLFHDVAYIEGYVNGLVYFLSEEKYREVLPFYFLMGCEKELKNIEEYTEASKEAEALHPSAYEFAKKITQTIRENDSVYHHTPFL
jgi:NAD-dependent SIR2 family protein deacetylase